MSAVLFRVGHVADLVRHGLAIPAECTGTRTPAGQVSRLTDPALLLLKAPQQSCSLPVHSGSSCPPTSDTGLLVYSPLSPPLFVPISTPPTPFCLDWAYPICPPIIFADIRPSDPSFSKLAQLGFVCSCIQLKLVLFLSNLLYNQYFLVDLYPEFHLCATAHRNDRPILPRSALSNRTVHRSSECVITLEDRGHAAHDMPAPEGVGQHWSWPAQRCMGSPGSWPTKPYTDSGFPLSHHLLRGGARCDRRPSRGASGELTRRQSPCPGA